MKVTIDLDAQKTDRFVRQAERFEQTVAEYILSWAECGLVGDEGDEMVEARVAERKKEGAT